MWQEQVRELPSLVDPVRQLLGHLRAPNASPLFLTGAGISVASGIAPFRGTDDAVWSKDVMEKGTNRFFLSQPHQSWSWYLSRFDKTREAEPNPFKIEAANEQNTRKPTLSRV